MDRIAADELITQRVAFHRAQIFAASAAGADDDLAPEDRPDRTEHGYPLVPNCRLKLDDDVLFSDGQTMRLICGGRGRDQIFVWYFSAQDGEAVMGLFANTAVDRAPADPSETALPIFEEAP